MSAANHGGSAFPFPAGSAKLSPTHGMTLRDYFAAKAMQAAIANHDAFRIKDDNELARRCYETADAMLRARSAT